MAEAKQSRNVLCIPGAHGAFQSTELDKFRKVVLTEGRWTHPTNEFTVEATPEYIRGIADRHAKYRDRVESFVPLGHTGDPLKNTGSIPLVEVGKDADGKATLSVVFDIKNPEVATKIRNKEITGVSVGIDPHFTVSNSDGSVDDVGPYLEHVALTQRPVIGQGHLGDFEPIAELGKDGKEVQYWNLAVADEEAFMDPPDAVVNGERLATHDECDYRAGTAKACCSACLAYRYCSDGCDFVDGPIKQAGLCNFYRPRNIWMCAADRELIENGVAVLAADVQQVNVELARDPKAPYGTVDYADSGYQKDKVKRYPLDSEQHVRAAWSYIGKDKNAAKYTSGQMKQIKSRIVAAWKKKIDKDGPPGAKEMDKEPTMPLELAALGKELGIEIKDDMDAKALASAIKDKLAPAAPGAETLDKDAITAELTKTFEAKRVAEKTEATAELAKRDVRINQLEHVRKVEKRATRIRERVAALDAPNWWTPAEKTLTLTRDFDADGKPKRMFLLDYDETKDAEFDQAWELAATRIEAKLEVFEARDHAAIPEEVTTHALGRVHQSAPTGSDDPKKLEEYLDKRSARFPKRQKQSA